MVTYYRGQVAADDFNSGVGTFNRMEDGVVQNKSQINKEYIPRKINIKTDDYTITTNITNGEYTFTNEGATKDITITLPVAKAGMGIFKFVIIEDTYAINVDPSGSEYFRDCAAGKYKYSSSAGNILRVWCEADGIWEYDYEVVTGKWDNES